MTTGTGLAQPMIGRFADQRQQRKQHRADRIGVNDRVERHTPEQPRRRVAQAVGRPCMRQFVERQGKQQDRKRDENLREVDIQQSLTGNRLAVGSRLLALGRPGA